MANVTHKQTRTTPTHLNKRLVCAVSGCGAAAGWSNACKADSFVWHCSASLFLKFLCYVNGIVPWVLFFALAVLPTASGLPPCLKHSPYLRDFAVQLLVMQIPALLCLAHNPLEIFETVRADKKVGGNRMI